MPRRDGSSSILYPWHEKLNLLKGEYTTGWTGSGASKSDKKVRVYCVDDKAYSRFSRLGLERLLEYILES